MKQFLILFICLFSSFANADFIASAGLQGGKLESENFTNNKPMLESPFFGFKGEIEFGGPYLTFFGTFDFSRGSGKTQYEFTDSDDTAETVTAEDLDTTIGITKVSGGMRLKLIKLKKFRLFIGGGLNTGFLTLAFDKDDFKNTNDSTTGYEEDERQNIHGGFGEVGMEFIFNANSGLRIAAQRISMRTDQFETLNSEQLKFNYTTYAVNFIEYIETGSW